MTEMKNSVRQRANGTWEGRYYGADGKPVKIAEGYAREEREWDADGHILSESYFDENGAPAGKIRDGDSILSAFPLIVLISPLCTIRRLGWARFQLGAVLVEKRE